MKNVFKWSLPLVAALTMTACGGDSSDNDDTNGDGGDGAEETTSSFTSSAQWVIAPSAIKEYCFDFDSNGEVTCSGTEWDMKFAMGTRSRSFYTNSGESGDGEGGTLGSPFAYTWETLQAFPSGTEDNDGNALSSYSYVTDSLDNAFANSDNSIGSAIFEYTSSHKLLANYSVILITTDNTTDYDATDTNVYAVQITGYYGGDSGATSGYPTLRYINVGDLTAGNVSEATEITLDASSDWVYFDLTSGSTITDPDSETWQIAFSRYNVKTNSGISGDGGVGSFYAQQPDGFYDDEGAFDDSASTDASIIAAAEADLTDTSGWNTFDSWSEDAAYSVLNPDYQGSYPSLLEYGFYSYDPTGSTAGTAHMLIAADENGVMLRSGSGDSYARVHLSTISYEDSTNASSQTTWTFDFDVQPAE